MKATTRILSLLLVLVMLCCALASCGEPADPTPNPGPDGGDEFDMDAYVAQSTELYNAVLGDFAAAYAAAKNAETVSEKYALMAIAEAKLLESGVMLPLTTNGGNYAISRVVPYTVTSVLWGNDSYRYHDALICTEPMKKADRDTIKALWKSMSDEGKTSAEWEAAVKAKVVELGYTIDTAATYKLGYSSDPQNWDVLATSRAADSEAIVNTYDGLFEYDLMNNLAPALATGYEVSEDGLKYTFTIREGVIWVDSQGNKVADVKADDFVAGMQHMMDVAGGLEYLVQGIIVGADAYITNETYDFSTVGVKAINDYTLEYTLTAPCTYFTTMLGYGVFAPMSRSYYESQGGKFGADFDASADSYTYGSDPDHIAYCGPYLVTNNTAENSITFTANEDYWNAENIELESIQWFFNDGRDALKAYNDMLSGAVAGAGLNAQALELAKKSDAKYAFNDYAYVSATDATSFMAFNNINRMQFANVNDANRANSYKTDAQKALAQKAMLNDNFRLALCMAVDRQTYNAQSVGEELALTSLRNSYTPGTFVKLEEEVTVAINGTDTTFPAGTHYGVIMQAQLDADNCPIVAYDPEADGGVGSSDGYDGWYNPDAAAEYLEAAIAELKAAGVTVDSKNKIVIEIPAYIGSTSYYNRAMAYKKSVEAVLGDYVTVTLVGCSSSSEWYYAGYYTDYGYQANYDVYDVSGWGPDYGDPSTYLDTFLPDFAGYMVKCIGIF